MAKNEMAQIPKASQLDTSVPDIKGAPCQSTDPETFFPDTSDYKQLHLAKSFCKECDAVTKSNCLDFALDNNIKYGVWGGMSEGERLQVLRKMRRGKR